MPAARPTLPRRRRSEGRWPGAIRLSRPAAGRLALFAAFLVALFAAPPASALTFRSGHGLRVVAVHEVTPRLFALVVKTSALPEAANIYILLPPNYKPLSKRRYPVLYLLHGTSGTASDWTLKGDAQQVIGNRELITVMPDIALNDGGGGWCTNWPDGAQSWETFHIDQLVPWVDSNLRTIRKRGERAIAGLSQGGFCSLSYAARHPDLFGIALGYSGAPDIYYDPEARAGALAIINATEVGLDHVPPDTFFGDPTTDGINWAAHDPATLAENLRWTKMYMYWGNGLPGPFDNATTLGEPQVIEGAVSQDNIDFEHRLDSLGIHANFDAYGPGTHTWPYWTRDLSWSIGPIMNDFAHPAPSPARFTYTSADNRYSVYGWSVTMHRTAREFSTLSGAGRRGFDLSGSGWATVTTPAVYKRHARYVVTLITAHGKTDRVKVTAGRNRRLKLKVTLGPSNPYQQYTPQAKLTGTVVYTTKVSIKRAPRRRG